MQGSIRAGKNELSAFVGTVHRLATPLLREALLEATLLTGLQIKAVFLDVLADAFALDLAAETTKCLLERFILANGYQNQGVLQLGL